MLEQLDFCVLNSLMRYLLLNGEVCMDALSLKSLINRYPFGALVICFISVLFSISQIIGLAKPSAPSFAMPDKTYLASIR